MKTASNLTADFIESAPNETRGIIATHVVMADPRNPRKITLGAAGVIISRTPQTQFFIPIAELIALAERAVPEMKAAVIPPAPK